MSSPVRRPSTIPRRGIDPAYNRDSRQPLLNDCWLVSAALQLVITRLTPADSVAQKLASARLDAAHSREA
jgi:hypothetical protein